MPDQSSHRPVTRINRRDVLAVALAAQVPLLAKVAGADVGDAATENEVASSARQRGTEYRETAHIRAYYDRSRF